MSKNQEFVIGLVVALVVAMLGMWLGVPEWLASL